MCVCSLRYPAWNAHAPYCQLWSGRLYNTFPHYLINGTVFGETSLDITCVFWFSIQILFETFFILGRSEGDMIKNVYWASCKVRFILVSFYWSLNFLDITSKILKLQFDKNLSSGSRIVPCGRTGRQTGRQSRRSKQWPFAILRTPITNPYNIQIQFVTRRKHFVIMLEKK